MNHFRLFQDDLIVASGSALCREALLREAHHYATVYAQDGPVRLQLRFGKGRWRDA